MVVAGWNPGRHEDELRSQSHGLGTNDLARFMGPLFSEHKTAALEQADALVLLPLIKG